MGIDAFLYRMDKRRERRDMNISPEKSKRGPNRGLEIVLKCDSIGSLEAVMTALSGMIDVGEIGIIQSGIGDINKSDIVMAETGDRLIVGFQVEVLPGTDKLLRERHVELRLYQVIYILTEDLKALFKGTTTFVPEEQVIGSARVIALFKGSRKGTILGCEISTGHLSVGQHFRIISVAGPVYSGTIASMQIGDRAIQKAIPGQKIGLKINDFKKARVGDLVESYRRAETGSPNKGYHVKST